MAIILTLARGIAFYNQTIKRGAYDLKSGMPLYRVRGKTLGIVGFGRIGRSLYRKARGFEIQIVVYDPHLDRPSLDGYDVEAVSFSELLKRSDYVSIHVPLTSETCRLFNLEAFQQMKPTAYLVNAARRDVVDSAGLLQALE